MMLSIPSKLVSESDVGVQINCPDVIFLQNHELQGSRVDTFGQDSYYIIFIDETVANRCPSLKKFIAG